NPKRISRLAQSILSTGNRPSVPTGAFWSLAFERSVLRDICALRNDLLVRRESDTANALRAIILGALHGPRLKNGQSSYFSNQSPRTFSPKPRYAFEYWRRRRLSPPKVDVLQIIRTRAERAYGSQFPVVKSIIQMSDSRYLDWESALR